MIVNNNMDFDVKWEWICCELRWGDKAKEGSLSDLDIFYTL